MIQVQLGSNKRQQSFFRLNNLLNQATFYQSCATPSSAFVPQKSSLSQVPTRENSNDSSSREESDLSTSEELEFTTDSQVQVEKLSESTNESTLLFQQRSNDEVRRSYINKLVSMKILDLQPKRKSQNLTIFDWDDTLFCTSFLGDQPFHKISMEVKSLVQTLDATTRKLLMRASRVSDVYIITNSDIKWIEQSAQIMLPMTYELINRKNIKIISARNEYKDLYPNDLSLWKKEAFLSLKKEYQNDAMTNIVVLGDSDLEMKAAKALGQQFRQAIVKTVKFEEHPSIEGLIRQLRTMLNLFDQIFADSKNLTVRLSKTQNQ